MNQETGVKNLPNAADGQRVTAGLYGVYHDVLRDRDGRIVWDRGWSKNTIVADCRRLLAGFMRGAPAALGIRGLMVGAGNPIWDTTSTPAPSPGQTALVDPTPFTFNLTSAQISYLNPGTGAVSPTPTERIQIVASLGPGIPPGPNPITLREFGLVGQLGAATVLINYVTHPAIVKDPTSTLERTIWLVF
jgi:hypothetical protein